MRLRPLTSRMIQRLTGRALRDRATEVRTLGGATRRTAQPAIALPRELDRLVRHHPDSRMHHNLARLLDPIVAQGPTVAYRIDDALIADGCLHGRAARMVLRSGRRRWGLPGGFEHRTQAVLCSYWATELYFAHWLIDTPTHERLAHDMGWAPVVLDPPLYAHEPGYRDLLGLPREAVNYACFDRLWVLEDHELNAHRLERLERNRALVRGKVAQTGAERVFISRGMTGVGRVLGNEAALCADLSALGFAIIEPERLTASAIAAALANARIVVAVEGSAIAHAVLAAPNDAAIVTIQPPRHFNSLYKTHCDALGMRFGYVIADPTGDETFIQPLDRLLQTIDLVDAALG